MDDPVLNTTSCSYREPVHVTGDGLTRLVERCSRLIINGAQAAQMSGTPTGNLEFLMSTDTSSHAISIYFIVS